MYRTNFLQKGDTVAIVSPSGPIKENALDFALETLSLWGLNVIVGKHVYDHWKVYAGSDADRAADFQEMVNNPNVKAIICSRGGYGAMRIINTIDFSAFATHPKWIVGFSDVTIFHSQLNNLNYQSIHGVMAKGFANVTPESLQSLHDVLFGVVRPIEFPSNCRNRCGTCSGELVGGNLSILYSLRGTPYEYDYSGKILFIEDLNEYLYHIDRMIQNLKHSGILRNVAGIIVGTMSNMKNGVDEYENSVEEIILDAVREYSYPVAFNFPSGHETLNHAIIIGGQYTLTVEEYSAQLVHAALLS